jgi:serine protease inhibitor
MKHDDPTHEFEQQLRSLTPRPLSDDAAESIRKDAVEPTPSPKRLMTWWAVAPLAAAACVVLALTIFWSGNPGTSNDPANITLANWQIQPTGDADYTILDKHSIRLDNGELLIESTQADHGTPNAQGLTVITPNGEAHATGTRFYIGTHAEPFPTPHTKGPVMKRLTRILILSGVVTLTNPLGSITGQSNELLAAEIDMAPTKLIAQANTDFAIDLYAQLSDENQGENLFFSPYSISSALAMATEGARGQTALEMGDVLGFPKQARRIGEDAQQLPWETSMIHTGYKQINERINGDQSEETAKKRAAIKELREQLAASNAIVKRFEKGDGVEHKEADKAMKAAQKLADQINAMERQIAAHELKVANALWGDQRFDLKNDYVDAIAKHYGTDGVQRVDFLNNFPKAAQHINQWVEDQTNDRIEDLIAEDGDPQTRLILTNAIFFKGDWSEPFDANFTKELPFHRADGKSSKTPIMYGRMELGRYAAFNADGSLFNTPTEISTRDNTDEPALYPEPDGFAMAELPYKGDEISMVLIAPNKADGLPAIEKRVTQERLNTWMSSLKKRDMEVYLPKFKMESKYDLNATLKALGIRQAFEPPTANGGADFSGISASDNPNDQLWIGKVIHKTFIEVNEKGTEAAAATIISFAGGGLPEMMPFDPEFRADRPFIYLIRDNQTGAILFMGRMMIPASE